MCSQQSSSSCLSLSSCESATHCITYAPLSLIPLASLYNRSFGIILKLCDTDELCSSVVGMESAYSVSVLVICSGLSVLFFPLFMFVRELIHARSIPIIRDARTLEPPLFSLAKVSATISF